MTRRRISIIILVTIALVFLMWNNKQEGTFIKNEGYIFGTTYHISYLSPNDEDYNDELHQHLMKVVNNSLSTFNKTSIISLINQNLEHQTDSAFELVYHRAQEIADITGGAFDITVAPLVNLWGFGYTKEDGTMPASTAVDSLLMIVGHESISLQNHTLIKEHPETKLDASAIAKGFSVDVAAAFLQRKGVTNFMVEIGGEIRVGGLNNNKEKWRLGIDKPVEDVTASTREIFDILHLTDIALATSGNYRQFYYKDGKRYSHTIDPKSGYPVNHNLLSATVLAQDCMTADALATACMVMGAEKSLQLAANIDGVEVYLIVDNNGKTEERVSEGLASYLQP